MHMYVQGEKEKSWKSLYKSFPIYPSFTFPFPNCFWSMIQIFLNNIFLLFWLKMEFALYFQFFHSAQGPVLTYTHIPHASLFCFTFLWIWRNINCGPHNFGNSTGSPWICLLSFNNQDSFLQESPHQLQGMQRIMVPSCFLLPESITHKGTTVHIQFSSHTNQFRDSIINQKATHLPLTCCTSHFTPFCLSFF